MDSNTSLQGGEDNDFPTGFLITTANDCLNLFLLLPRLIRSSSSFWCCRCTFSWSWSYGSYRPKCLPALTVGEASLDKWKSLCLTQVGGNTFYSTSAGSSGNQTSSEGGIDKTSQVPQQESSCIREFAAQRVKLTSLCSLPTTKLSNWLWYCSPTKSCNTRHGCHFIPQHCVLSLYPRVAPWCQIPSSNSTGFSNAWFQMNHIWSYFWSGHQSMLGVGFV